MTVFTVDRLGRKPIQIGGFAILTIIFCVLGFAWKGLTKVHLLALYVLAQFFFNFGKSKHVSGQVDQLTYNAKAQMLQHSSPRLRYFL